MHLLKMYSTYTSNIQFVKSDYMIDPKYCGNAVKFQTVLLRITSVNFKEFREQKTK